MQFTDCDVTYKTLMLAMYNIYQDDGNSNKAIKSIFLRHLDEFNDTKQTMDLSGINFSGVFHDDTIDVLLLLARLYKVTEDSSIIKEVLEKFVSTRNVKTAFIPITTELNRLRDSGKDFDETDLFLRLSKKVVDSIIDEQKMFRFHLNFAIIALLLLKVREFYGEAIENSPLSIFDNVGSSIDPGMMKSLIKEICDSYFNMVVSKDFCPYPGALPLYLDKDKVNFRPEYIRLQKRVYSILFRGLDEVIEEEYHSPCLESLRDVYKTMKESYNVQVSEHTPEELSQLYYMYLSPYLFSTKQSRTLASLSLNITDNGRCMSEFHGKLAFESSDEILYVTQESKYTPEVEEVRNAVAEIIDNSFLAIIYDFMETTNAPMGSDGSRHVIFSLNHLVNESNEVYDEGELYIDKHRAELTRLTSKYIREHFTPRSVFSHVIACILRRNTVIQWLPIFSAWCESEYNKNLSKDILEQDIVRDSVYSEVDDVLDEKDKTIDELRVELTRTKKELNYVRKEYARRLSHIENAERVLGRTERADNKFRNNGSLDDMLVQPSESELETDNTHSDEEIPEVDTSAKFLFIVNDQKGKKKVRAMFPNAIISIDGAYNITKQNANTIPLCVAITSSINHTEYYRVKEQCKSFGVPLVSINVTNMDKVKEEMGKALYKLEKEKH